MTTHARTPSHPARPTEAPVYPVLEHHLATFLPEAQDADALVWPIPARVERDSRSYLNCGMLEHAFARLLGTDRGYDRLLALSNDALDGVLRSLNSDRFPL